MSAYTIRIEIDIDAATVDEAIAQADALAAQISGAIGEPTRVGLITDSDGEDVN